MKNSDKSAHIVNLKALHVGKRFVIILMFLVFCAHYVNLRASQFTDTSSNDLMSKSYIHNTVIVPAVENLRIASTQDSNLLLWLDQLKLVTSLAFHTGPKAYATMSNGLPVVNINARFILSCLNISDLAGLMMTRPSKNLITKVGEKYGREISAAIKAGKPVPSYIIDLDKLNLPPSQYVFAKQMSYQSFGAVIQWVILHEIAHHQLKHFEREPRDLAESREWEVAADTWAIKEMQYLGFSLHPLEVVLMTFMLEEEIKRLTGIIKPVEYSTHPSWKQRLQNLKRFDTQKPTDFGNWISVFEVSPDPLTDKFYVNELLIPRNSMPGVLGQFRQFGKIIQMPVEHFADGSIHIYGRSPLNLSEIIVSNLGSLYPTIQSKYTDIYSGQVSETKQYGYQADMAYYFSKTVPGKGFESYNIRDVMNLDPMVLFKENLRLVEDNPNIVAQSIKIQQQLVLEYHEIMLKYAKGIIDLLTAEQMMQRNASAKIEEIRLLLGDRKYMKMREKILATPMVAGALDRLLQQ